MGEIIDEGNQPEEEEEEKKGRGGEGGGGERGGIGRGVKAFSYCHSNHFPLIVVMLSYFHISDCYEHFLTIFILQKSRENLHTFF